MGSSKAKGLLDGLAAESKNATCEGGVKRLMRLGILWLPEQGSNLRPAD